MSTPLTREQWPFYLNSFYLHNQGRPTELKLFNYLPVERQLPLYGLCLEETGTNAPKLEILLGGLTGETEHIAHTISAVKSIAPLNEAQRYQGLEIVDENGVRTELVVAPVQHLLTAAEHYLQRLPDKQV